MTETKQTYATNKLVPQNLDAENAVIGSILINPSTYEEVDGLLDGEDFYLISNGLIWRIFEGLRRRESRIDILTVSDVLDKIGKLEEIGGIAYLSKLVNNIPTTLHVEAYARIVKDKSRRRNLLENANRLARIAYNEQANLLTDVDVIVDDITSGVSTRNDGAVHIACFTGQLVAEVEERMEHPGEVWGMKTGFYDYDNMTGGLQPSELLLISGDSGVGKSMFAGQVAQQLAVEKYPGVFYSLEMKGTAVARRMISGVSKIATRKIKTGSISDIEFAQFIKHTEELNYLPLFMSDASDWTLSQLRSDLALMKRKYDVKWFVLDYLYLMDAGRVKDETEKTTILSNGLKRICRSLDLSGIAITSMNKTGMDTFKPLKSSMRGSGQGIYDCDVLCIITKDEVNPNLRRFTLSKGRETEVDNYSFDLIKEDTFPFFKNTVKRSLQL